MELKYVFFLIFLWNFSSFVSSYEERDPSSINRRMARRSAFWNSDGEAEPEPEHFSRRKRSYDEEVLSYGAGGGIRHRRSVLKYLIKGKRPYNDPGYGHEQQIEEGSHYSAGYQPDGSKVYDEYPHYPPFLPVEGYEPILVEPRPAVVVDVEDSSSVGDQENPEDVPDEEYQVPSPSTSDEPEENPGETPDEDYQVPSFPDDQGSFDDDEEEEEAGVDEVDDAPADNDENDEEEGKEEAPVVFVSEGDTFPPRFEDYEEEAGEVLTLEAE